MSTTDRLWRMAQGRPLETAVLKALKDAADTSHEIYDRIDTRTIGVEEAHSRLLAAHEARSAAVMRLPRKHPWVPMLMEFIRHRGEALAHLLRDRDDPKRANMVQDGDRRMAATLGLLR